MSRTHEPPAGRRRRQAGGPRSPGQDVKAPQETQFLAEAFEVASRRVHFLNLSLERYHESGAGFGLLGAFNNIGNGKREFCVLLGWRNIGPAFGEEEGRQAALMPRGLLVLAFANAIIARNNHPIPLPAKLRNPFYVRSVRLEFVLQVRELVVGGEKLVQCPGMADSQAIIEEKPHAARPFSNSIASFISSSDNSYHRATSLMEREAAADLASTSVGMP